MTSATLNPITSAWEGKKQLYPTAAVCLRIQADREPLLKDSGQAKETICPGLVEWLAASWRAGILCSAFQERGGEGGAGLGDEKGAGTHPKNQYFWENPCWTELEQADRPIFSVLK